jgi:vacuolar-type H+-ATPase subunit F/Vma7
MTSGKIAIIGSAELFMGFKALGVDIHDPAQSGLSASEVLSMLGPVEYAIVFIGEHYSEGILDEIMYRNKKMSQSVIIIPSGRERSGIAGKRIRQLVRRAVGADIL